MRVVIAEDNALLSTGLELILSARDIGVDAVVTDAPGLIAAVRTHAPDLVVTDVRLPPTFRDEGLRAALELRRMRPGLPILVLSQYVEHVYARDLLSDGVGGVGYLLKDRVGRMSEFVDSLRRVVAGETVLDPEVLSQLMTAAAGSPLEPLSPREHEVLALMARGLDNGEIAEILLITANAVHKHVGNIFGKLGLLASDAGHRRVRAVLTYLRDNR
ncbi:DNA-binding response regulator [Embleya scabrispora]|uniref:DNA-binding response regulator n=1 Tax=Embleya scabrispora TaxID=159449 RepID=A0A1T3NLA0_9ACTN|nr:response regulator transcription factor [Embleya scabrispora]OPC77510.1 DNA-binding response regulator [Embleya scabrispora]